MESYIDILGIDVVITVSSLKIRVSEIVDRVISKLSVTVVVVRLS